jgi:CRISPR/Cas system-associated exonuclease Cas4 (RecB family)
MKRFIVGPSQLGWLRADCERCFVREVAYGVRRPGGPPDAFNLADAAMKRRFDGGPEIQHDLGVGPPFTVIAQGLHVQSKPIIFPEYEIELVIKGRLDALVRTVESAETLVVDYKTATRDELDPRTYAAQLQAYATALEIAHNEALSTAIDGLALLIYRPHAFTYRADRRIAGLYGTSEWLEVPRDDFKFEVLLRRVAALLGGREQAQPNPQCGYCSYYGALPWQAVS